MPAGAASRYALGADGAGAARPAPATSLISASRYAPGARRTALRAEGAARLCARRSCWLPSPGLALRARCRGCGRCAPGRLRQSFRRLALRARRRRRGRCAPGRLHVAPPPPLMRALPLGGGDVEDVVRFTLLETLVARRASRSCRGRGWGGVVQTSSCASVRGNACVLPPHVQCASARSAAGIGAPSPQARPIPRTLSAPARRGRHVRVQTAARRTFGGGGARTNSELPQAGFPCSGEVPIRYSRTLHARALVINRDDDELFAGCRAGLVVHAEVALALTLTLTLPR